MLRLKGVTFNTVSIMTEVLSPYETPVENLLQQQLEYYSRRAFEYDEWWTRKGRYNRGPQQTQAWQMNIDAFKEALSESAPLGSVLELACGTGIWTDYLASRSTKVHAIDASLEMLKIAQQRVPTENVHFEMADLFEWQPGKAYDTIFFSFWLSHVPDEKLESFFKMVNMGLKPNGRLIILDSRPNPMSSAIDHPEENIERTISIRRLNDGSEYSIFKRFFTMDTLADLLDSNGFVPQAGTTGRYFVYTITSKK